MLGESIFRAPSFRHRKFFGYILVRCPIIDVEKIDRGINGDLASALLQMLDPEQDSSLLDP